MLLIAVCAAGIFTGSVLRISAETGKSDKASARTASVIAEMPKENGLIVCRAGIGFASELIKNTNDIEKRYSHMGIMVIDSCGVFVIHADDGDNPKDGKVVKTPLCQYLEKSEGFGVYRAEKADGAAVAKNAEKYIGRPFDWNLDLRNSDAVYCTELVSLVLHDVNPEIQFIPKKIKDKDFLTMDTILSHCKCICSGKF